MSVLGSKRGNGHLNVTNLTINVISNVDQVEALMEQYLIFHTNFLWDKAKEFIEHERDTFRAAHQSHVSSILASLMNALSQLTLADKNYLTLQFFSSKVFQRKDSYVFPCFCYIIYCVIFAIGLVSNVVMKIYGKSLCVWRNAAAPWANSCRGVDHSLTRLTIRVTIQLIHHQVTFVHIKVSNTSS